MFPEFVCCVFSQDLHLLCHSFRTYRVGWNGLPDTCTIGPRGFIPAVVVQVSLGSSRSLLGLLRVAKQIRGQVLPTLGHNTTVEEVKSALSTIRAGSLYAMVNQDCLGCCCLLSSVPLRLSASSVACVVPHTLWDSRSIVDVFARVPGGRPA
jgi:hypothetical protein